MSQEIDIWAWTYADRKSFRAEGGLKKAIIDYYEEFWGYYNNDPIQADMAIHQAIDAARASGETRWELHLRHWRIQNWLSQGQIRRVLPEAIDLLSLAVDERVKDVPQRICAYHDVVECYVDIDPAGYCQEIEENAQHILAQIPKRYPCADCARANLARATAAAGKVAESEHWLAEDMANHHASPVAAATLAGRGGTYVQLGQWEKAEQAYTESSKIAHKEKESLRYLKALLGIARARIGRGDLEGAQEIMPYVRESARYEGGSLLIARLLEVEGYLAALCQVPRAAQDYFARSAHIYCELGQARDAAELALQALEIAREHHFDEPPDALATAEQAVGMLPPTSQDLYQRLSELGGTPRDSVEQGLSLDGRETIEQMKEREERKELADLEGLLQAHLHNGLLTGITSALFRIGIWHDSHNQTRAALDYFIWAAALERLGHTPLEEREGALKALKYLGEKLPAGSVNAALRAAEAAPPTTLLPLLKTVEMQEWRWLLQSIATEVRGHPVVEPEPEKESPQARFENWLEHCASMSALIVRFHKQADPEKCAHWAASFHEMLQEMEAHDGPEQNKEMRSLLLGFIALGQGQSVEQVAPTVLEPFRGIILQIGRVAELPVWRHPGNAPLDYLIEQAAQRAVRALRTRDEHRAGRLANLAFRYELLTFDMREHEELAGEIKYLEALSALLLHDGQLLPEHTAGLSESYVAIVNAVAEAGREKQ